MAKVPSSFTQLPGSEHPLAKKHPKATERDLASAAISAKEPIELTVIVRANAQHDWNSIAAAEFIKPKRVKRLMDDDEFAHCFSSDQADMDHVASVLEDYGLKVAKVDPLTRRVEVVGPWATVEKVFQVKLMNQKCKDGSICRAYQGAVSVPSEIAGIVEHVLGLETIPLIERPLATGPSEVKWPPPMYEVPDLIQLYEFPDDNQGEGQTVGIVLFGGGFLKSDMVEYFDSIKMPMPRFKIVGNNNPANRAEMRKLVGTVSEVACDPEKTPEGEAEKTPDGDAGGNASWTYETTMDMQLVGALANKARIIVYFLGGLDARSLVLGLLDVLTNSGYRPDILSGSWGFPEGGHITQSLFAWLDDVVFKGLAARGVSMCFASGDTGSTIPGDKPEHGTELEVTFPASSPYCLACGGTSLKAKSGQILAETVWNSPSGASGGGVSNAFPRIPFWQASAEVARKTNRVGRGVPDVAANADAFTGCRLVLGGCTFNTNGTSAAAPIWAALLARIYSSLGVSMGLVTPFFYQKDVAATFNDITKKDNIWPAENTVKDYVALAGWDACTGWGRPNGIALRDALSKFVSDEDTAPIVPDTKRLTVVDFGRTSEKQVSLLRRGRGKLAREISALAEQLDKDKGTVVAVVETRKKPDFWDLLLGCSND